MITIPTTELIGGIQDMLPIVLDDKSSLAGLAIEWDGESLHFTAYDVFAAATVAWTPGEGAEGVIGDGDEEHDDDVDWGGDDAPWRTWIYLDAAKEIVKLFKLPAKLWRTPVTLKCTPVGGDLLIERIDSPRGNRELRVPGDPDKARRDIPTVDAIRYPMGTENGFTESASFFHARLGAFGAARAHGTLTMEFGGADSPVGITMGKRYAGFIYPTGAKDVRPFNFLRDGAGLVTS